MNPMTPHLDSLSQGACFLSETLIMLSQSIAPDRWYPAIWLPARVGHVTVTKSGLNCMRWDVPGRHSFSQDSQYADGYISAAANYCRNPASSTPWPWCIPLERNMWEYCDFDTLACRRGERQQYVWNSFCAIISM